MDIDSMHEFHRPIIWNNDQDKWHYSLGGTINFAKYKNEIYLITAQHCLNKEGYEISKATVAWKRGSRNYITPGVGANFGLKTPSGDDMRTDVAIHKPTIPVEAPNFFDGEILEIRPYIPHKHYPVLFLSGYPSKDCEITYGDDGSINTFASTFIGMYGGGTNDEDCHYFRSPDLVGVDADGLSGSLVTSIVNGHVQLEGLCVQGAGNEEIDFVRYVGSKTLFEHLKLAEQALP